MAGITQNGQKSLIFIVFPELWNTYGSGFVKKEKNKESNNNNNVTEALNNPSDNSNCLLV